jgi:SAM-dependent methyltransferase
MPDLKLTIPEGFNHPTALPRSAEDQESWQIANREWWESHPMRYDFRDRIQADEFSKEFYEEIDRRFFADVRTFMPWRRVPFDSLIDFQALSTSDVLEIGVGNGSHAQLISPVARSYTGIDLTEYAVTSTSRRVKLFHLDRPQVTLERMDAERMTFPDDSFDLVWSWGVVHHSANTRRIMEETQRVLRPGGIAIMMVYYRNFWNYYVVAGFCRGLLQGSLLRTRSLHKTRQYMMDGALARYYSIPEWRSLVSDLFTVKDIRIFGSKSELVPLPSGKIKNGIKAIVPDSVGRILTNRLRFGTFLVSTLQKPGS